MLKLTSVVAAAILAGSALAHPGHDVEAEALERRSFNQKQPRTPAACASKLRARGHTDRAIQRRAALANELRVARGLDNERPYFSKNKKRTTEDVLATSHHSNLTGVTTETDPSVLFADYSSCVLQPDETEGPYYVTGELIREDIRETQEGIDSTIYLQFVDTSTCEPLDNIYVDFWHCNSTGVYGGIVGNGNGNSADASNINNTFHRGIQATDDDGVATFLTTLPGHYTGRTNHIHILTHLPNDTTVYDNGTLGTSAPLATHIGQLYFDQDLLNEAETFPPYVDNTQTVTTNAQDFLLAQEAETSDPVLEYVLLGDTVGDGLLFWATIGIDTTNTVSASNAAYVGEEGGVAVPRGGRGGGGGGPGGPGGPGFPGFPFTATAA